MTSPGQAYSGEVDQALDSVALERAVALARAAVSAPDGLPGRARPVRRLDGGAPYALVDLGRDGEHGWVAAVDPRAGEVMTWAVNASGRTTAPELPSGVRAADAELVWRPSRQTRSPLYPLLRVVTADGTVFVDLSGRPWPSLLEGRA